ncbi:uncharacterized protein NECHADRAFT_48319 [Fusarium vanettenii 77-13-4]|uniref:Uncharacterized protein n=1 Tax=Fusarium vanettenii (strain ATCC MYA-4622 / CBS 123669 / FGSC 9596 / NRRL 45880 / 77-13-4) TaxID=660122 RepID=C7ZD49_FUSV7|nr:uncharacterized protein NECHADRAFT_48319 [Fusarium vanettenii 77-13-4]EEU38030.1 hypothetical protein NECHADRAFT_48319 [Fusarium vanettenii 77-13-4]
MAPIRTALIGLSASAKTSWAAVAHLPYLISPRGKSKYQIVALCNSSVEAARKSIEHFKLPAETKAYGDPESLAADDEIDLVVVITRVDVHHSTALPSVKAGKAVYVEWPLAQDEEHARELATLAKESGSRTVVGLQGRVAPPIAKIHELLQQGRIGKVLSSELRASGGTNDREILPSGLTYFTRRAVGGNIYTIGLGHLFDQVQYVLGDIANFKSRLHLQRPNVKVRDPATNKIIETVKSDVPDLIFATGTLKGSETSQEGASVLIRFRRGQPFPGEAPLVFTINGEKGEIRLKAEGGTGLHANSYDAPVTIEVDDFETGKVEEIAWQWQDWQEELPVVSRSVAAVYEKFAEGDRKGLVSFYDALFRHEQLNGLLREWDSDSSR